MLEEIILLFEGGHLQRDKRNDTYNLRINTLKLILSKVLPHFTAYPVRHAKYRSFSKVVELMQNKEHLSAEGLAKIIAIVFQ